MARQELERLLRPAPGRRVCATAARNPGKARERAPLALIELERASEAGLGVPDLPEGEERAAPVGMNEGQSGIPGKHRLEFREGRRRPFEAQQAESQRIARGGVARREAHRAPEQILGFRQPPLFFQLQREDVVEQRVLESVGARRLGERRGLRMPAGLRDSLNGEQGIDIGRGMRPISATTCAAGSRSHIRGSCDCANPS